MRTHRRSRRLRATVPAVAATGALACGTQLCGADGDPVQLRGMSSHGMQWYAQCVTGASLGALATDWKANTVRISTYVQEGGYETDPEKFNPGDPAHNTERAKTFFSAIADKYAGAGNVIYEIANEPHGVSWHTIKDYAETIIPVIRERDPDSVVLVGTRGWSSLGQAEGATEQEIVDSPVAAKNIMYTYHFYAATHGQNYLRTLERAAARLPLFVSEFGLDEASGDGANDLPMGRKYLDLMAREKIGWTAWNYSDDAQSSAVFKPGTCASGDFAGDSSLKESGTFLRDRMRTEATG
ncbi:glycoside hydrolase family 5 protein [Streptomyces sp. A7024]|uniref:cellulase n=1 Tax=Streptomyces coryli TaxID=1128680 RepID=A0A6G4UCU5_9ACTN|nr:glycoside hydrolase family 5 protein [Streptomyces coryli]NGN69021.1 glycoside hydrolase family 5 protein [Streptomyces coryli]